jgi:hypothetical protein
MASRIANNPILFESLPNWFTGGYAKLFGVLGSGSTLAAAVRSFQKRAGINFLIWIVALNLLWLPTTVGLSQFLKKPSVVEPSSQKSADVPPPYKKTWHKQNEQNQDYVATMRAPGSCENFANSNTEYCHWMKSAQPFGGDDYWDHWEMRLVAPGPPYE